MKTLRKLLLLLIVIVLTLSISACTDSASNDDTSTAPTDTSTVPTDTSADVSDEVMIKLFVGETKFTMTEAEFLALPQTTVTLSKTNKAGETTTGEYSGVHWTDIADFLDIDSNISVTLVASDDYEVTLTTDILNDPNSIFALYQDGSYIESEDDGRIWFCASENFESSNWVKYVTKIVVE